MKSADLDFEKNLTREYFKHGSVEKALRKNNYDLPISEASYHRLLNKWGVIKAAGPNSPFAEVISFVSRYAEEGTTFKRAYRAMPLTFQTSAKSLYRVLSYVKRGLTRRVATILVICPHGEKGKTLIAEDISAPRVDLGKPYGAITFPMGFSRKRDSNKVNIKRLLQQEVFSNDTIEQVFPDEVIPKNPKPFMYIDIADVRASVYLIELSQKYSKTKCFSSFKLRNYKFVNNSVLEKIASKKAVRDGVVQIFSVYRELQGSKYSIAITPLVRKSQVNSSLI